MSLASRIRYVLSREPIALKELHNAMPGEHRHDLRNRSWIWSTRGRSSDRGNRANGINDTPSSEDPRSDEADSPRNSNPAR